jgi:hypothetical protein
MSIHQPTYVREFLRWRQASPSRRREVIREQARMVLLFPEDMHSLDSLTPNGKPLGDCTGDECGEIGDWFDALGNAKRRRVDALEALADSM